MKIVIYVVFGVLILAVSIFVLRPDSEKSETTEKPKTTAQIPELEATTLAEKHPEAITGHIEASHETIKQNESTPAEPLATSKGFDTSRKQENFLDAPQGSLFDMSNMPSFPPLPQLGEDDDTLPFSELPTKGFGNDDFAQDDFAADGGLTMEGEFPNDEF